MVEQATTRDAYNLLHEGILLFADMQAAGMYVDTEYLLSELAAIAEEVDHLKKQVRSSELGKAWFDRYPGKANLNSPEQLGVVLYEVLGHTPLKATASGNKPSTDEDSLEYIGTDEPGLADLLRIRKLEKMGSTYVQGLLREQVDGYVVPMFGYVRTGRSNCHDPNLQNVPKRDDEIRRRVRAAFRSRWPKGQLLEVDYGQLEVRISATYNRDPKLVEYVTDPSSDMHRDMARECFLLENQPVPKEVRFYTKHDFVFPQFYGDYYVNCAKALWKNVVHAGLRLDDGCEMLDYLGHAHGIAGYGAFEKHIQQVEHAFWQRRFKVYNAWREEWYQQYQRDLYFDMYTGFRCTGYMHRNDVINYPVQGTAFHCLLAACVEANRRMRDKGMNSLLVMETHDSVLFDVYPGEVEALLALARDCMVKHVHSRFARWLDVPLEIEAEMGQPGAPWSEIEEVEL